MSSNAGWRLLGPGPYLVEARAAVHRSVVARRERDHRLASAAAADRRVELPRSTDGTGPLGKRPASRAPLRVVEQALAREKCLLAGGGRELLRTVAAGQRAVLVHPLPSLLLVRRDGRPRPPLRDADLARADRRAMRGRESPVPEPRLMTGRILVESRLGALEIRSSGQNLARDSQIGEPALVNRADPGAAAHRPGGGNRPAGRGVRGGMPKIRLPLATVTLALAPGAAPAAPGPPSPGASAPPPSPTQSGVDHPTGATDVVLRMEVGGGFVPIDFP